MTNKKMTYSAAIFFLLIVFGFVLFKADKGGVINSLSDSPVKTNSIDQINSSQKYTLNSASPYQQASSHSRQAQQDEAQTALQLYRTELVGRGFGAREQLDKIRTLGLKQSKENKDIIAELLKNRISEDEKIGLLRLYANQFDPKIPDNGILKDLEEIFKSSNSPRLQAEVALAYSRVGSISKGFDFLSVARSSSSISEDQYYGELAHNYFRANQLEQKKIIVDISKSDNSYARQILVNNFSNLDLSGVKGTSGVAEVLDFVKNNEPKFSGDSLSAFDLLAYKDWLVAYGKLNGKVTGQPSNQFILNHLLNQDRDPRALISYFSSPENTEFARENFSLADRQRILDSMIKYSMKNPTDFIVAQVQDISSQVISQRR